MKKYKVMKIVAIILIVISIGDVMYRLIESIVYNVNGWHLSIPGPALYKWYEIFFFNMMWDIETFVGVTFIIGVVLLILANKIAKAKLEKMED